MDLMTEWIDPALPQAAAASGMVRIARGGQQRWIWPVHLPGWIALGWQVSHPGTAAPAAAVAGIGELDEQAQDQAQTQAQAEAISPDDSQPEMNGRRRGRKAKAQVSAAAELVTEPMAAATAAEPDAEESLAEAAAESAPATAKAEASTPDATAVEADEEAASPAIVLPDDLLSETF